MKKIIMNKMWKALSVILSVVLLLTLVPLAKTPAGQRSYAEPAQQLVDVDAFGTYPNQIKGVSFDGVLYDGVNVTRDGRPIDWNTMSNYVSGFTWMGEYTPVDMGDPDAPSEISFVGWIGLDRPIAAFGYIVGNEEPVFDDSFMNAAEQGVLDAGGQYAKRFNVTIPVGEISASGRTMIYLVTRLNDNRVIVWNSDVYPSLMLGFELYTGQEQTGQENDLTIASCNLAFENNTYVMYAVAGDDLSDVKLLVWKDARPSYTYGTQDDILEPSRTEMLQGQEMLVFEYTKLAAKQIPDAIYARAFSDNGGTASYSELKKYSTLQYIYNKTGRTGTASPNASLIDVLETLKEYGAAAQIYTRYKTTRLATDDFYQIKVVGGKLSDQATDGLYRPGDVVTMTASAFDGNGGEFSCWQNGAGAVISSDRTIDITVGTADETYTAVFEASSAPQVGNFRVANVFGSDMVVQRGEPVVIWGFADTKYDGGRIYGEFMGYEAEATVENGRWEMTFDCALEANAQLGNNMRIYSAAREIVLSDILVGDVYFVIGQSNTAYTMNAHWAYTDANDVDRCSVNADFSYPIRIQYNGMDVSNGHIRGSADVIQDIAQKNTWKVPTAGRLQNFSAIGYIFAWNYCRMTDSTVPVGVIEFNGNGQPLSVFLPNEIASQYGTDVYNQAQGIYITNGVFAIESRFMYNGYMAAFEGMSMAGILWYQGESDFNTMERNRYGEVYKAYMDFMRSKHNTNNKDFPVYFVEFPPIYTQPASYPDQNIYDWQYIDVGMIRGRMGAMSLLDDNFYQVQSSDLWHDRTFWNNLHPNCKYEQALRAAEIACAVNGEGDISISEASGPVIESVTFDANGKSAEIKFKNVGTGLKTIDGAASVKGFQYGRNTTDTVSTAIVGRIIAPDTVKVELTGAAARLYTIDCLGYNCTTTMEFGIDINLCNSFDVPAGAFMVNRT